ncbi:hypothetical protein [Streptomyces sp. NPDC045369]|uniref:hypothetical protein n=1 Tax=Streptomyces sp. NPDC045369 TaxID=3155732 RepID=UPI0033DE78B6
MHLDEEATKPGQFDTTLDVWHHVQTSNAVTDILDASPSLRARATSATAHGRPVIAGFLSSRATGRVRLPHVYEGGHRTRLG